MHSFEMQTHDGRPYAPKVTPFDPLTLRPHPKAQRQVIGPSYIYSWLSWVHL